MQYYDLFNEALDDLAATLGQITGLVVTADPTAINPPCVLIGAPTFEAWNYNIAKVQFPVTLIGSGPGNVTTLRALLSMSAQLLAKNVAVTAGRPRTLALAGGEYPAYDLDVAVQAQTG